jgi:hypothetical protein
MHTWEIAGSLKQTFSTLSAPTAPGTLVPAMLSFQLSEAHGTDHSLKLDCLIDTLPAPTGSSQLTKR